MQILLATDGSDCARQARDFLTRFPFPRGSSVNLLTVVDRAVLDNGNTQPLTDNENRLLDETVRSVRTEAELLLQEEEQNLQKSNWTVKAAEIRTGNPAEEIISAAEELEADLVVVGSHGWTGVKSFLLGSVSHRILHHAPCSVLVVKHGSGPLPSSTPPPWHILIAYDDSATAKKAVRLCASLPLDETTEITAIGVMPMITLYRQDIRQRLDPIWQHKKQAAKVALESAVSAETWPTNRITTHLREGPDISQVLLQAAEDYNCHLIMLGCKGTGAIERFLLGSISYRVTRHANCAVWAVRE